jgi:hypothetical protein
VKLSVPCAGTIELGVIGGFLRANPPSAFMIERPAS